jgi:hypothetical protein
MQSLDSKFAKIGEIPVLTNTPENFYGYMANHLFQI